MKTIEAMVANYVLGGMTVNQAESYACQKIVLNKIAKSPLSNKVLIKGGVVMYNITHNLRRTTLDLDFDFIQYDISEDSIARFVDLLNIYDKQYIIAIRKIDELHQEDYQGKRVFAIIKDTTSKIGFKMDIGVHTLASIKQEEMRFSFDNDDGIILSINPPEQIFAEKLYSLLKHNVLSTRFKDVFDMYYLIKEKNLTSKIVKEVINELISNNNTIVLNKNIKQTVKSIFQSKRYISNFDSTKEKWIDVEYLELTNTILKYLESLYI